MSELAAQREQVAREVAPIVDKIAEVHLPWLLNKEWMAALITDLILSREAGLQAERDSLMANLELCKGNELAAERDRLHALLTRCLTELDGNEMDKVRGVLVGEIVQVLGEK